ncbi:MAG: hypothetical protein DME25_03255 [Verrucomicrobia bacterium]|nr:MAG: hypothetical protein DME25_03255 [Verrucomicrobiota bacterium]
MVKFGIEQPWMLRPPRLAGRGFRRLDEKNVLCFCHFCSTWLRFQISRAGQTVNCPYCLMETVLYVPEQAPPGAPKKCRLELRKIAWTASELGYRCVAGEVFNSSRENLAWVRIEFILFSSAQSVIGSTSDCLIDFPSRKAWKFKAPVFNGEVVRASLPILSTEYGRTDLGEVGSIVSASERLEEIPPYQPRL